MSIALAPDFDSSGRLFAQYASEAGPGTIHVAELLAPGPAHTSAALTRQLLEIPHASAANHNGGQLQFGPDGFLYASTGDGGGSNDQFHNSQKPGSLLGRILRIDPDAAAPVTPQVWSLGLRNPYRFSFDALSGDLVIGDVGQGIREEVDLAPSPFPGVVGGSGANYGWNCREGLIAGPADDLEPGECASAYAAGAFVDPVFDYGHDADPAFPNRCSITGGYVARDPALGNLYGHYVYSDYCSGVIRSLLLPAAAGGKAQDDCSLGLRVKNPVSFGEDAARRLYVVEQSGQIYRFAGQPPAGCPAPISPISPPQPQPGPSAGNPEVARATIPTFVGIKADRRRVERGKFATLTAFVSPCDGRHGEALQLLRSGSPNGSRSLSRACTARFVRRVRSDTGFAVLSRERDAYLPGRSRQLTIRIATGGRGRP
jgi:hypothetical protein